MRINIVKEIIEQLITFLHPLLPLANFHMVDYFIIKNPLNIFFDENVIKEIESLGNEEVSHRILQDDYCHLPHLKAYVDLSRNFKLSNYPNICLSNDELQQKLTTLEGHVSSVLKMNVFMTSKKSHEVEALSSLCDKVHHISNTSHLVDIGDGKGYLSSFLSLHYKIPVLGIDASEINTKGAVERVKKLSRVWNSISNEDLKKNYKETTSDLYKQITMFVDDKVNVKQLISDVFLTNPTKVGLVGLHTCGDLSASSIRLFVANEDVKTLCNVGCCYHFINEKFEKTPNVNYGFPLSNYLQSKSFVIGRAARMIAAQSIERVLSKQEAPSTSLFYRSLYEVLLNNKFPNLNSTEKQVGRFRKECTNFVEYVEKASHRLKLEIDISNEEIMQLYTQYENRRHELSLFYLLRGLLSSSIESLILLDRLLFLLENNYEQSFLVKLFDPVISPRCFGLIAIK